MIATILSPGPELASPDPLAVFERNFALGCALADCECQNHDGVHSSVEGCGQRAEYRLTGRSPLPSRFPTVSTLLCRACVDWQVNQFHLVSPTLVLSIQPI